MDFDPDQYLASKSSFDPDAYLKSIGPQPGVAEDAYKSLGTGVLHGLAGFYPDIRHGGQTLENIFREKLGIPLKEVAPGGGEVNKRLDESLGLHQPGTPFGQATERAGEFIGNPASYIGPGSIPLKAGTAALGGLGSYGGEKLTEGMAPGYGPVGSFAGAVLGGSAPSMAAKAITPNAAERLHSLDIDTLKKEGIKTLTAGDITGNNNLRAAESEFSTGLNTQQKREFEQAAFNKVGETIGDRRVTGEGGALETMKNRIGKAFDDVEGRNNAQMDNQAVDALKKIHTEFNRPGIYTKEVRDNIDGNINRVLDAFQNQTGNKRMAIAPSGQLSGEDYQTVRSSIRGQAMAKEDPDHARGLHQLANAMDETMERSIAKNNPTDLGAFQKARDDYKASLVLRKWGNSKERTPDALRQADKQVYGDDAHNMGKTPFAPLADAGARSISAYRSSETARRGFIGEHGTKAIAGLGGYLAGAHYGNPEMGVLAGLTAEQAGQLLARPIARKTLMSSPVQSYLGNQLIPAEMQEALSTPLSARLARALGQTVPNQ